MDKIYRKLLQVCVWIRIDLLGKFIPNGGTQLVALQGTIISLFDLVDGKTRLVTTCELYAVGRNIASVHFKGKD